MEEAEMKAEIKSWKSIAIAGLIITLMAMALVAIGNPTQVSQYRKFIRNESKQLCENFEMRYRYIDSSCYECYIPLSSYKDMSNVTFVYRFCNDGSFEHWNRTMKYLESWNRWETPVK